MKLLLRKFILLLLICCCCQKLSAQCATGWNNATVNWEHLDYLTRNGTYSAFVTNQMRDTQYFTIGVNRVKIQLNGIATAGENILNTAEAGSYGNGADVEYSGMGTIKLTFDTAVKNLQFSLYDVDLSQAVTVTAADAGGTPLNVDVNTIASGIITVSGSGTPTAIATANATSAPSFDTRATINVDVNGGTTGVRTVLISISASAGNFWLSDITACVFGSFPTNYYISQKPFTGQPAYYLVTPDNNSVYLFNPRTGVADHIFSEPVSPWINSMAYDHVNRILYYTMDNPTPLSNNKSLKKYDFNTETVGTVIADVSTLGIPLFDIVVESAGAAFYNGSLFLGIEGTNGGKNSNRESIVWRIDFDAAQNPVKVSQVFARPADNGSGTLTHDWGDFTIKDGMLFDFNTGNSGSTAQFVHFNMQNGAAIMFNTNGSPAPIQVGQIWDGTLFWTGGQSPELGRVAVYNENGTIGPKIAATTTVCSPPWVGRAGDASDPFRPKSDFGDAPSSYDPIPMEKATHEYNCNLRLGATFDREWDKTSSGDATADGSDEDGISTVTVLPRGIVTYVQDVKVYNNTGSNATVVAWLDYNGNGTFDAAEGITRTIPSNTAMQTITLAWAGIPISLPVGSRTFLRVRITSASNGMGVSNATRWYSNGEVEDYPVMVEVILPGQLLKFTAQPEGNVRARLNWTTGREINFKGFVIERSTDGFAWKDLDFVPGNSNGLPVNDYVFYDEYPEAGISYYRLKLISADNRHQHSMVRVVDMKNLSATLRIMPNPAKTATQLTFYHTRNEKVNIAIIDLSGRRVMQTTFAATPGLNRVQLSNISQLVPGMYTIQVITSEGMMQQKLTKQ